MSANRTLITTISGVAALGFVVLAIIYWIFVANPPLSFSGMDWTLRILIIAAVVSFSIFLLVSPESVGRAATSRSNKLTANAIVVSLVAVAIAIFLNVLAESVPDVRADWTAGQSFTLSPQTIKVVQELKNNVSAVAFFSPRGSTTSTQQQAQDLLKEYTAHSSKLTYRFVDPYTSPAEASTYGVTRLGSVVFDNGQKREIATGISEADFTGALVRLTQTGEKSVAFLTGHGERDPNGVDELGYSQVKAAIEKDNYVTQILDLSRTSTITATVLIIADPKNPISTKDMQTVQQYLDKGGHLMLILDPLMPTAAFQPLANMLTKYGVTAVEGGVIDLQNSYSQQEPTLVGVSTYPTNDITADLARDKLTTLFPLSMGFKPPTSTVGGFVVNPIIQSSNGADASWLETSIKPDLQGRIALEYTPNVDLPGPVDMALSIGPDTSTTTTNTQQLKTRLVVYGDSDFASNLAVQQQVPNLDLFANSISWLAGANELVSIRAKAADAPRTITLSASNQNVLLLSTVVGLPLLVLLAGALVWWRRK